MSTYKITKIEAQDHEEILDFLNEHFVPNEPINAAINLCEKGYRWNKTVNIEVKGSRTLVLSLIFKYNSKFFFC